MLKKKVMNCIHYIHCNKTKALRPLKHTSSIGKPSCFELKIYEKNKTRFLPLLFPLFIITPLYFIKPQPLHDSETLLCQLYKSPSQFWFSSTTYSQLYSNPILINKTKHSDNQIKIRFLEWDDLWDHDNRYPNRKWQTEQLNEYG